MWVGPTIPSKPLTWCPVPHERPVRKYGLLERRVHGVVLDRGVEFLFEGAEADGYAGFRGRR
jgi:hypothetical protein